MKIISPLLISLFLIITQALFANTEGELELKEDAKTYALTIVSAYFAEDCDYILNAFSDSILLMDGDGKFAIKGKEEKLCSSVKEAIRDKEKTMDDYLENYVVDMHTTKELTERFGKSLPEYFVASETDVFFIGFYLKEGIDSSVNFIWDDLFIFMLRKENGEWRIKGISG